MAVRTLPCPRCGTPVERAGATAHCPGCGFTGTVRAKSRRAVPADPTGPGPAAGQPTLAGGVGLRPPEAAGELGRLGPYRVLGLLGTGGMGAVFRAEDTQLQLLVALMLVLPKFAAAGVAKQRFLREARLAAAVEHAHVVPIHQVGADRGVPFLAMPLLK